MRALLLDVEGTTTPIEFVSGVLFPYARQQVRGFLDRQAEDEAVRADLALLRQEHAADERAGALPPAWRGDIEDAVAYVHFLMDRDRKSTALKSLQGRIWQEGFSSGALRGEVYPDVPAALERWRGQGREVAIFSSGSVLAQKLLFGSTRAGDLNRHIRAYFDTTTGAKREARSYRRISEALSVQPDQILFLSDVIEELDAARAASLLTALCVREEGASSPAGSHPLVRSFEAVFP